MRGSAMILFAAAMAALPVLAQTTQIVGQRPTDAVFTADGLTSVISGYKMEFYDGSLARYNSDGAYAYIYQPGDPPFVGNWTVRDAGEICVVFENGAARCDHFVRNGDRLVLIIANGDRYPVRTKTLAD